MRIIQGYAAFEVPVKVAGSVEDSGQTFCRIRRPDGGWDTHLGTQAEIMAHLKTLCPGGKLAELRTAPQGVRL